MASRSWHDHTKSYTKYLCIETGHLLQFLCIHSCNLQSTVLPRDFLCKSVQSSFRLITTVYCYQSPPCALPWSLPMVFHFCLFLLVLHSPFHKRWPLNQNADVGLFRLKWLGCKLLPPHWTQIIRNKSYILSWNSCWTSLWINCCFCLRGLYLIISRCFPDIIC